MSKCRHRWAAVSSRVCLGNVIVEQVCECEKCHALRYEKESAMSRDIQAATKRVANMTDDEIALSARHDPDIFRDVARAALAEARTKERLNRLDNLGLKDAADFARNPNSR